MKRASITPNLRVLLVVIHKCVKYVNISGLIVVILCDLQYETYTLIEML